MGLSFFPFLSVFDWGEAGLFALAQNKEAGFKPSGEILKLPPAIGLI
jgi:hypothetical protein